MELLQIKQKDLKEWRKQQWLKQKRKCAVTGLPLPFKDSVVDHCHKTKAEEAGIDGKGLIRGVIHKNVNQLEGKILSAYKRFRLCEVAELSAILRGMADYLENPPVQDTLHPSCIPKIKKKKLWKADIKRVLKYWEYMYPKRKPPKLIPFTKTGKPSIHYETKEWTKYILKSKELRDKEKK